MSDPDTTSVPFPELIATHVPAFDQHPAVIYLFGLGSERSRRVMAQSLRTIVSILGGVDATDADFMLINWSAIRRLHSVYIRSQLAAQYRPATANRTLSALRGVLKTAWNLGQIDDTAYRAAIDVARIPTAKSANGRAVTPAEIMALVQACKADESPAGARDAAIIGLFYTCGLRRSELVALVIEDFDPFTNQLRIQSAKGEARNLVVEGGALQALLDCIEQTQRTAGPLFVPILKGGHLTDRPMNVQSIYDMLQKRARQAGIKPFSPHDLRRTFIGGMLQQGVDLTTTASLAGHASTDTTQNYARPSGRRRTTLADYPY